MAQLICKNLSLGYEGKTVTKDINFSVNRGDYICIVGENGSGKSTLVKALLRLIKPQSGEVIISDDVLKSGIGYLPQQTEIQNDFPASVKEIVLSGCSSKKRGLFYSSTAKKAAHDAMHKLEIEEYSRKTFKFLSGGQQQRVFLARALCSTGELLILDEPVTGLDPAVTEELYNLLDKLNKKNNLSVIMVSHDINSAVKYATHILHIGKTQLFFGKTEDYLKSETGKQFLYSGGDAR